MIGPTQAKKMGAGLLASVERTQQEKHELPFAIGWHGTNHNDDKRRIYKVVKQTLTGYGYTVRLLPPPDDREAAVERQMKALETRNATQAEELARLRRENRALRQQLSDANLANEIAVQHATTVAYFTTEQVARIINRTESTVVRHCQKGTWRAEKVQSHGRGRWHILITNESAIRAAYNASLKRKRDI